MERNVPTCVPLTVDANAHEMQFMANSPSLGREICLV